jgi:hypothetical protein
MTSTAVCAFPHGQKLDNVPWYVDLSHMLQISAFSTAA